MDWEFCLAGLALLDLDNQVVNINHQVYTPSLAQLAIKEFRGILSGHASTCKLIVSDLVRNLELNELGLGRRCTLPLPAHHFFGIHRT